MKICLVVLNDLFYLPKNIKWFLSKYNKEIGLIALLPPKIPHENYFVFIKRIWNMYGFLPLTIQCMRLVLLKLLDISGIFIPFIKYNSICKLARKHKIPSKHISNVNCSSFFKYLKKYEVNLIISIAAPQIFKKKLLEFPKLGCINLHGAYLPYYRGVFSAFWVLLNREKFTGATVHYMTTKIDAGDIIFREQYPITKKDNIDSLCNKTTELGIKLLDLTIEAIKNKKVKRQHNNIKLGQYNSYPTSEDRKLFKQRGCKYFKFLC